MTVGPCSVRCRLRRFNAEQELRPEAPNRCSLLKGVYHFGAGVEPSPSVKRLTHISDSGDGSLCTCVALLWMMVFQS